MGYKINRQKRDMQANNRPIYILVWGDSPACATGFATVTKNIFIPLAQSGRYEIDFIGINDRGEWKDPEKYPMRIYPARSSTDTSMADFHGRPRLIAALAGKDPDVKPPWDIVFFLNDPFILEDPVPVFDKGTLDVVCDIQELYKKKAPPEAQFKTVAYWPVDSVVRNNWVEHAIAKTDYSIAYTNYAVDEIKKADMLVTPPTNITNRMKVIYHGINTKQFFPIDAVKKSEFRKQYFEGKVTDDMFVVTTVARNQQRKDIDRTMHIFKEFQRRRPNSILYIHAQESDAYGSLRELARNYNLELGKDWGYPSGFSANMGFPVEAVNLIYGASDCIISTTLGEGFGFYNFEGMATKVPVLFPNNTCHPELYGYDKKEDISDMETLYTRVRGIPMKSGSTTSEFIMLGPSDLVRSRPIVNVDDGVKKLMWVYDNPDKVKEITERAYQWVQSYTWDTIVKEWDQLFTSVYADLEKEREQLKKDRETQKKEPVAQP